MTAMTRVKVEEDTGPMMGKTDGAPTTETLSPPRHPIMKVRVMATYMVLLLRLVLPALLAAYRALLRNQRCVLDRLVPAVFAFIANSISLSSLSGRASSGEESLLEGAAGAAGAAGESAEATPDAAGAVSAGPAAVAAAGAVCTIPSEPAPERCVSCEVLHDPGEKNRRADVIFIHGLHGSLEKTWRQGSWRESPTVRPMAMRRMESTPTFLDEMFSTPPDYDEEAEEEGRSEEGGGVLLEGEETGRRPPPEEPYSECWPRDWLPQDCPGLRVIALNYTTDPFLWRPLWVAKKHRTNMLQRSREMMEHLQAIGVGDHPIIWVGHSKGGLFVKQMIVDAYENGGESLMGIYKNTRAIMFYSVPHMGSACADINLPLLRQSVELTEVQKDCREVLELHSKFLSMVENKYLRAEVFSFIETIPTFMRILYIQIVSLESADAAIGQLYGVPLDHRNICKPTNRQCFLYRELIGLIHKHVL